MAGRDLVPADQKQIISDIVRQVKQELINATNRPNVPLVEQLASQIYLAKAPGGGISARSGITLGIGLDCDIYQAVKVDSDWQATQTDNKRDVLNPSSSAVAAGEYVVIKKDPWGAWLVDSPSGGGGGSTPITIVNSDSYVEIHETTTGSGGGDNFVINLNTVNVTTLIQYVINHFDFTSLFEVIFNTLLQQQLNLSYNVYNSIVLQQQQYNQSINCCLVYSVTCQCMYCPDGAPFAYTIYLPGAVEDGGGFYTLFWTSSCSWHGVAWWGTLDLVLAAGGYTGTVTITGGDTVIFLLSETGTGTREGACCDPITLVYSSGASGAHPAAITFDPVGDCLDADSICGVTVACCSNSLPKHLWVNLSNIQTACQATFGGATASYEAIWDPVNHWWFVNNGGPLNITLSCSGSTWTITIGDYGSATQTTAVCSPFELTFIGFTMHGICSGTLDIDVIPP